MIEASCHCGAVRFEIATAPPAKVTDCNCSSCRKLGVLRDYYLPEQVRIIAPEGATTTYKWNDVVIEFHTCRSCGCTTHYLPFEQRCPEVVAVDDYDGARLQPLRQKS